MKELTDADFSDFISSNKAVVIDFWAEWCGPCKIVAPVFGELAQEFSKKAVFAKLDITNNPGIANKFGVASIPTFLVFKDGEVAGEFHGAMAKEDFRSKLEELI